jgi:hypothetical protein
MWDVEKKKPGDLPRLPAWAAADDGAMNDRRDKKKGQKRSKHCIVSMVNSGCKPDARWTTHMEMGWAQE